MRRKITVPRRLFKFGECDIFGSKAGLLCNVCMDVATTIHLSLAGCEAGWGINEGRWVSVAISLTPVMEDYN
jgi:hypothetical protein